MNRLTMLLVVCVGACAGTDEEFDPLTDCEQGLCDVARTEALCTARVVGRGNVDVENVYLPHVVACENPNGDAASLRAQAIAARSYLYQILATRGSIKDGQGDQVFTCGRQPTAAHYEAVAATSGQFLTYRDVTVAAFYVAGAFQSGSSCSSAGSDPTRTERYVTYNANRSGGRVRQTRLGWVSRRNRANRGAMSQHGANCLAERGNSTREILEFYYGTDIQIAQAFGACVDAEVPSATDVGTPCEDDAQCDEHCELSIDGGFCSAACSFSCPEGSACVDLGMGEGRCAALADVDNCSAIPGTEPAVLPTAKSQWRSVCAPRALGTSCSVADAPLAECIDTNATECAGTIYIGRCPGPNAIRCCTEPSYL